MQEEIDDSMLKTWSAGGGRRSLGEFIEWGSMLEIINRNMCALVWFLG